MVNIDCLLGFNKRIKFGGEFVRGCGCGGLINYIFYEDEEILLIFFYFSWFVWEGI